jgi:hypothetical protein
MKSNQTSSPPTAMTFGMCDAIHQAPHNFEAFAHDYAPMFGSVMSNEG